MELISRYEKNLVELGKDWQWESFNGKTDYINQEITHTEDGPRISESARRADSAGKS